MKPTNPYSWEIAQNEARQWAARDAKAFAMQPTRAAQNIFLLDSHRSVMYGARWFVMSWEHSSWDSH